MRERQSAQALDARGEEHGAPAVYVRDLTFSYPDGSQALRGLSLRVRRGETVAVIGANGAGKSTLMLHLNGILCTPGAVQICGVPVRRDTFRAVRRLVGLVFQNPDDQLFCPTVADDVAFGPRNLGLAEEEIAHRVRSSLAAVGLEGYEQRSPIHLSVGEKKRAAIATVHAMSPKVWVFDEPTSSLDPRGRRQTATLLEGLEGTRLFVTHDLELVRALAPRTILMHRGTVIADGSTAAVLRDDALLESAGVI